MLDLHQRITLATCLRAICRYGNTSRGCDLPSTSGHTIVEVIRFRSRMILRNEKSCQSFSSRTALSASFDIKSVEWYHSIANSDVYILANIILGGVASISQHRGGLDLMV